MRRLTVGLSLLLILAGVVGAAALAPAHEGDHVVSGQDGGPGNSSRSAATPLTPSNLCEFEGASGSSTRECASSLLARSTGDSPDVTTVPGDGPVPPFSATELGAGTEAGTDAFGQVVELDGGPPLGDRTAISGGQAVAVFEEEFGELVQDSTVSPIPDQAQVVAETGHGTAVIDGPNQGRQLVTSTQPITLPGDGDTPVDLSLDASSGADFRPQDPIVDVSLPDTSRGEAELTEVGLSVSPVGVADKPARPLDKQTLFYPNVQNDTDLILRSRAAGFEFLAQLRSRNSPHSLEFELDLPAGTAAVAGLDGAVLIRNESSTLATISSPVAFDAAGRRVEVSLRAEGSMLLLEAERNSAIQYPILIDPQVYDSYYWPWGSPFTGWSGTTTDSDFGVLPFPSGTWVPAGLYISAPGARTYGGFTNGQFTYVVPHANPGLPGTTDTTAYIPNAQFEVANFSVAAGANGSKPRMRLGTWSIDQAAWVRAKVMEQTASTTGTRLGPGVPSQPGIDPNGTDALVYQIYNPDNSPISPTHDRSGYVNGVHITLDDKESPSAWVSGTGGWVSRNQANYPMRVDAHDGGLGVKTLVMATGWDSTGALVGAPVQPTASCDGSARSQCPQTLGYQFTVDVSQLRDGLQASFGGALDILGKSVIAGRAYGIDGRAPRLADLSIASDGSGGIWVDPRVVDGSPDGRDPSKQSDMAGAESGVRTVEILANGQVVDSEQRPCVGDGIEDNEFPTRAPELPWGSCEMNPEFKLSAAQLASNPVVTIRATDEVGNSETFSVNTSLRNASANPIPDVVASRCGAGGPLTTENAIEEIEIDTPPQAVRTLAEDEFGGDFKGMYIERDSCPATVNVIIDGATAAQTSDFTTAATIEDIETANVEVVDGAFSDADLGQAAVAASAALDAAGVDNHVAELDLEEQRVTIFSTPLSPGVEESVTDSVEDETGPPSDVPIQYETETLSADLLHSVRSNFPPFDGGLNNYFYNTGSQTRGDNCTSGFVVKRNDNQLATTAGHCVRGDQTGDYFSMKIGGAIVGYIQNNRYWKQKEEGKYVTADALLYGVDDGVAKKQITVNTSPEPFHRYVTGELLQPDFVRGRNFCYTGIATGSGCGDVTNVYRHFTIDSPLGEIKYDKLVCGASDELDDASYGDSGAPIYVRLGTGRALAAGSLIGEFGIAGYPQLCVSPFGDVREALNVELARSKR